LSAYFAILLVPKVWPAFAATGVYALYLLSVLGVLVGLAGVVLWGVVEVAVAWLRRQSVEARHRLWIAVAVWGLISFAAVFELQHAVRGALPTGSHTWEFDSAAWKHPNAAFAQRDITTRQKMLASVVDRLEPSLDRADIEALLGPSGMTKHFEDADYDLIYRTGFQRDVWFSVDSEWLVIWLDDAGKFERYAIYGD
jgi:hypothetical protein